MGIFDSSPNGNTAHGANDIPAPRPDSAVNAPPPDQHKRVIDFVRVSDPPISFSSLSIFLTCITCFVFRTKSLYQEAPGARYTFDSRANRDAPDAELCRVTPQGGRSCIKVG